MVNTNVLVCLYIINSYEYVWCWFEILKYVPLNILSLNFLVPISVDKLRISLFW